MVNILSWNVRGLNGPNKQREVQILCNNQKMNLIGLLETKIKRDNIDEIASKMFVGWKFDTNLDNHYNGRIWVTWRPNYYRVNTLMKITQLITCEAMCLPLQISFEISYVYDFNTMEERKELWKFWCNKAKCVGNCGWC